MTNCKECSLEQIEQKSPNYFKINDGQLLVFGCRKHVDEMAKKVKLSKFMIPVNDVKFIKVSEREEHGN